MSAWIGQTPWGSFNELNITAATVVKASRGVILQISVNVAGSAAGAVYDAAATTGNVAANLVAPIPSAISASPIPYNFMCLSGILIVPPTGGTVSVSYA